MMLRYQNAMAVVRSVGKPDYFITMTYAILKVPDIVKSLKPYDKDEYRTDIVARVFSGKVEELKELILKKNIFGSASL